VGPDLTAFFRVRRTGSVLVCVGVGALGAGCSRALYGCQTALKVAFCRRSMGLCGAVVGPVRLSASAEWALSRPAVSMCCFKPGVRGGAVSDERR
jgi:hypothetical protein